MIQLELLIKNKKQENNFSKPIYSNKATNPRIIAIQVGVSMPTAVLAAISAPPEVSVEPLLAILLVDPELLISVVPLLVTELLVESELVEGPPEELVDGPPEELEESAALELVAEDALELVERLPEELAEAAALELVALELVVELPEVVAELEVVALLLVLEVDVLLLEDVVDVLPLELELDVVEVVEEVEVVLPAIGGIPPI
jgi:hypothetical protein